jgi:hypothetical protein
VRSTSPAISSTMMVEVVEAMIGLGPASTDARADASRLRSSTSGTASKITATEAKAGPASEMGTTAIRLAHRPDMGFPRTGRRQQGSPPASPPLAVATRRGRD